MLRKEIVYIFRDFAGYRGRGSIFTTDPKLVGEYSE